MNAEKQPLVSIVIPVFNGSDYIRDAIESCLSQTYSPIEILVVNDGSKDDGKTETICYEFGAKIRYFQKENGGVSTALNLALTQMKGVYFSWLSHDDLYHPDKISRQVECLKSNPGSIAYCDVEFIDSQGQIKGNCPIFDSNNFIENVLIECTLNGCSLLIPKKAFEVAGPFRTDLRTVQDIDRWFTFHQLGFRFLRIPAPLVRSRQHSEQATYTMASTHLREVNDFYCRLIDSLPQSSSAIDFPKTQRILGRTAHNHLTRSLFKSALRAHQTHITFFNSPWHSSLTRLTFRMQQLFYQTRYSLHILKSRLG